MITPEVLQRLEVLLSVASALPNYDPTFIPPVLTDPNYTPANTGPTLVITTLIFTTLLIIGVGIRLYTRAVYAGRWYLEDWLALAGTLVTLPITGVNIYAALKGGLGMHVWDLTIEQIEESYRLQYAAIIGYSTCAILIKFAIISCVYRLESSKFRKRICVGLAVFTVAINATIVLLFTFGCAPASSAWDIHAKAKAKCVKRFYKTLFEVGIVAYAILDLVCLLLPAPLVWGLRLPLRKKLEIGAIFGIGSLAVMVALIRIKYLKLITTSFDISLNSLGAVICDTIELDVGLLATCVPLIRLFVQKKFPHLASNLRQRLCNATVIKGLARKSPIGERALARLQHNKRACVSGGSGAALTSTERRELEQVDLERDGYHGENSSEECPALVSPTMLALPMDDNEEEERKRRLQLRYRMADVDFDETIPQLEKWDRLNRLDQQLQIGISSR